LSLNRHFERQIFGKKLSGSVIPEIAVYIRNVLSPTLQPGVEASPMISEFLPKIDAAMCVGCELCVKLCPNEVLALVNEIAAVINPQACEYTGACQEICPPGAINLTYEIVF
jgi:formate hydrogenlyase subunit 6/NADH:ubiquinone oxidoreductase subunit I